MTPPTDPNATASVPAEPQGVTGSFPAGRGEAPPPPSGVEVPGYEILDELGRGGMGVVYKARQVSLNRVVALKMLPGADYAEPHERSRFLAEAEAVAAVRHPHVVQVYDFGSQGSRPYFAMEYLAGGSLLQLIRKSGRLAATTAAAILEKIARGVHAVHDLGIVHRDIKPQNVLLDAAGEPKVTDFGLAKRGGRTDLTRTGAVMGTPHYMAPEQAAGKTKFVGPAADIYALGAILYECLTGRTPFAAEDTVQLLVKVVEDEPESIRTHAPEVPRDLEAVCMKCLRKDPQARYATAEELAADLRRFLNGESVAARSTGVFGKVFGALDRSGKDIEFSGYANVLFGFAVVTLLAESIQTASALGAIPGWVGATAQYTRLALYIVIVWVARRGELLPRTATERQLWSIVCGYAVACTGAAIALRLSIGGMAGGEVEQVLYQAFAALAALMFFALGSVLWGRCYGFGLLFLLVAVAMSAAMPYSALMFGVIWAGVMTAFGFRLRRLAREAATRTS